MGDLLINLSNGSYWGALRGSTIQTADNSPGTIKYFIIGFLLIYLLFLLFKDKS